MIARLLDEADRPAMLELARAMQVEQAPDLTFDEGRFNATLDRSLATANPVIFVAEDAGEVLGFLVASAVNYAACAGFYLEHQLFYVRPDKRGGRAAAKLLTEANWWADRIKPTDVFASMAWGRRSDAAARWLRRFGFEPARQQLLRRRMSGP